MSKIRILNTNGLKNVPAILEMAKDAELDSVVVIGWKADGYWFHTSHEYNKDVLWDLELTKAVTLGFE